MRHHLDGGRHLGTMRQLEGSGRLSAAGRLNEQRYRSLVERTAVSDAAEKYKKAAVEADAGRASLSGAAVNKRKKEHQEGAPAGQSERQGPAKRAKTTQDDLQSTEPESKLKPQQQQQQDEKSSDDDLCSVCMDQPKTAVFTACGHHACCLDCAKACRACVVCRKPSSAVRLYKV